MCNTGTAIFAPVVISAPKLKLGAISYENLYPYKVGLYLLMALYALSIAIQNLLAFRMAHFENTA